MDTEIIMEHIIDRKEENANRIHDHLAKVDFRELNRRIAEGTTRRIQQELKTIGDGR